MSPLRKKEPDLTKKRVGAPARTPNARERQLISLTNDLAEKQLLDGTATSQVMTHFLNLGSSKMQLELEKLREENKLLRAKTAQIESQKKTEELYRQALRAMKSYSGNIDTSSESEDDIDTD